MQATKRADPHDLKTIFLKVILLFTKTETFGVLTDNTEHRNSVLHVMLQSVSSFCLVSIEIQFSKGHTYAFTNFGFASTENLALALT